MNSRYAFVIDGHVVANLDINLHTREIVSLHVDFAWRRQGYGRRIMKMVCDQADREGVILCLMAAGSRDAMSTAQLEAWYARFGFKPAANCLMERKPRI